MFRLTRPGVEDIRRYLNTQQNAPWSYAAVGATQTDQPPVGYDWDQTRVLLGHGASTFVRAKAALERWAMFPRPLVGLYWPDAPLEVGTVVAVLFRGGPVWSLNAARIVYVVDEPSSEVSRFGFAYGTLVDHAEEGEERFLVEWRRADDSVWYDLAAFSRPRHGAGAAGVSVFAAVAGEVSTTIGIGDAAGGAVERNGINRR